MTNHVKTAVGKVDFTDGRLTFLNPRLVPEGTHELLFDGRNVHIGTYTHNKEKVRSQHADWSENDTIFDAIKASAALRKLAAQDYNTQAVELQCGEMKFDFYQKECCGLRKTHCDDCENQAFFTIRR